MPLHAVNVFTVVPEDRLDEAGFRHAQAKLGPRLGSGRIGASVYVAEPQVPIWPYHFHHGIEEWLYVIDGAPVLREPAGERVLAPDDLVRFPAGRAGAHAVTGPGRFLLVATGYFDAPFLTVYPDSDKVSGPEGIFARGSAVGYWHGEGTHGPAAAEADAEDIDTPCPSELTATRLELAPGQASDRYSYVVGREEWLLVLEGAVTIRHPEGQDRLEPGDLVCFPDGPGGARQVRNDGDAPVRALSLATSGVPANVCFPDDDEWVMHNS